MDVHRVLVAEVGSHLANGFEEGQRLDVANGSADFRDDDIGFLLDRNFLDQRFDLVSDVGNDLDGSAEVVAASLGFDDVFVNLSGGDAATFGAVDVHESLVVAEVEVSFGAVFGDKDFTMLERVHGSGVDVDVRVQFDGGDGEATVSEKPSEARGGDSFANPAHNSARYKDIFRRHFCL